jgi:O-antigen/teichoic acid export membrane protein
MRIIATTRDSRERMNKAFSELLLINILASIGMTIIYLVSIFFIPKVNQSIYLFLIVGLQLLLNSLLVDWLFQGNENYRYLSIRHLVIKLVSVVLIFIFIRLSKNYLIYAAIVVLGTNGANIYNIIKSKEYVRFSLQGISILKHLKPLKIFYAISIISTIGMNLDKVVIGYIHGDIQVGYYVVADKLIQVVLAFTTSFATVLLPRISYYFSERRMAEYYNKLNTSFKLILFISLPFMIISILEADAIVRFLGGKNYLLAVPAIQLLSPNIFLISLCHLTGIQILFSMGRERKYLISLVACVVSIPIAMLLFIPLKGYLGVAMAMVTAYSVQVAVNVFFSWNELKVFAFRPENLKYPLSALIMGTAIYSMRKIHLPMGWFVRLTGELVIGISIYIAFLLLLRENVILKFNKETTI